MCIRDRSATRSCFAAAVRRRAEGDPPRVLHVFGVMDRGGAEMRTIELTEGLGADVDAHFLTLRGRPGVLDARIRTTGGRIHPVPLGLSFPLRYLRLLRQVRPDVIDSHVATFSGVLLVGAWAAGVPRRIAHFRSDGDDHGHSLRRRVQRSVMRWLIDRSATDIIGVSPSSLSAGYRATWSDDPRCRVIPNGIREALSPTEINLRHALEIPDDALLIMHVGRPSPEKNRSRLPGILRHVAGRHPAHLVLVGGEGDDEDELSSAITTSAVEGLVHHLGSIDGVREVMAQADVLVQPSLREGLPGVVLEAASVGTPVVSSDVPGATWIEEHVPTVRTLPLAQSDSQWASSVIAAAKDGPTRNEARSAFRDSIFTFDASRQTHAQIWRRP